MGSVSTAGATGLDSGQFFILEREGSADHSRSQPWRDWTSLITTMTEEGLSQPVEGMGRGSHRQLQVGGPIIGSFPSPPLPLVSRFNYPKPLLTDGWLRIQPHLND